MTTIACTKTEIACDLQITSGTSKFKGKSKIYSYEPSDFCNEEHMIGFCGTIQAGYRMLEWIADPGERKPPKGGSCEYLVLTRSGKMFCFQEVDNWIEIDEEFYSIGSGSYFALGAMQAGSSASEAVKIASKYDTNTGMGVERFGWE